jgi:hypothetical protein
LGRRDIGYDDAARIRKRAGNPVKAWKGDDGVAYAADPENDDRFHLKQTPTADAFISPRTHHKATSEKLDLQKVGC